MDDLKIIRQTDDFRSEVTENINMYRTLSLKEKAEVGKQLIYDKIALQKYKEIQDITVCRLVDEKDQIGSERDIYKNELQKTDSYDQKKVQKMIDLQSKNKKAIVVSNEKNKIEILKTLEILKQTNQKSVSS